MFMQQNFVKSYMFYAMLQTLLDSWFVYNQQFPSVLQSGSGSALEQSAIEMKQEKSAFSLQITNTEIYNYYLL